jgi:hypothetical protein
MSTAREARENVEHAGVGALASIRRADVFSVDLQPATVVTLLLPELNVRLSADAGPTGTK